MYVGAVVDSTTTAVVLQFYVWQGCVRVKKEAPKVAFGPHNLCCRRVYMCTRSRDVKLKLSFDEANEKRRNISTASTAAVFLLDFFRVLFCSRPGSVL